MNDDDIKQPERTRRYNPADDTEGKVMVGFKVVHKQYSQVRAIFAELGQSDTALRIALKEGHGIVIPPMDDPTLYFIISQDQIDGLKKAKIAAPTWLQLLGSSPCIGLNEEETVAKFRAMNA